MIKLPSREPDATYFDEFHIFWFEEMIRTHKDITYGLPMHINDAGLISDREDSKSGYINEVQKLYQNWFNNKIIEEVLLGKDEL